MVERVLVERLLVAPGATRSRGMTLGIVGQELRATPTTDHQCTEQKRREWSESEGEPCCFFHEVDQGGFDPAFQKDRVAQCIMPSAGGFDQGVSRNREVLTREASFIAEIA